MRIKIACLLMGMLFVSSAHANWQYPGTFVGEGHYADDGMRFVLSARAGAAYGMGAIKNNVGILVEAYYDDSDILLGTADIGKLAPEQDFSSMEFAAGAGIGVTLPNAPQWRIGMEWDHVTQADYNVSPLFSGDVMLTDGQLVGQTVNVFSGGAHSNVTTDVFGIMAYYDFFDGTQKPIGEFIPYLGFGLGYADSTTVLNLTDLSGYLSTAAELVPTYGELNEYGVVQFYESKYSNANVAGLLAAGFSYGLAESVFLDLGARMTYIPEVKWTLSNEDGTRHRDWYSAENVMYFSVMAGLRFEF